MNLMLYMIYFLVYDLFDLQRFDDVSDELRMYISVMDFFVQEYVYGVLW